MRVSIEKCFCARGSKNEVVFSFCRRKDSDGRKDEKTVSELLRRENFSDI